MIEGFRPGDIIVMPGGGQAAIVRTPYAFEEVPPGRVCIRGSDNVRPERIKCRPVKTLNDLPVDAQCGDTWSMARAARPGYTIACDCTTRWGHGAEVLTPCCGRVKHISRDPAGEWVECPKCRWHWRCYVSLSRTRTRWVSLGFARRVKSRKAKKERS
jgi:hypothetical protein